MTEAVRCIECLGLKLRENPKMAALGFGQCTHKPPHEFQSVVFQRDCKRFRPDTADKVQGRVDWYNKRDTK